MAPVSINTEHHLIDIAGGKKQKPGWLDIPTFYSVTINLAKLASYGAVMIIYRSGLLWLPSISTAVGGLLS